MNDQKNTILAIALSVLVFIAWQYFFGLPQMEKQKQAAQPPQGQQQPVPGPADTRPRAPGQPAPNAQGVTLTRPEALAKSPQRIQVETPLLKGSIALTGARIDDLALSKYHETV